MTLLEKKTEKASKTNGTHYFPGDMLVFREVYGCFQK